MYLYVISLTRKEDNISYHLSLPQLFSSRHAMMLGGMCGCVVNTSTSGSGGPGFKTRLSRCFLKQGT